jgi:type VI secretion system secreted protein VgrG
MKEFAGAAAESFRAPFLASPIAISEAEQKKYSQLFDLSILMDIESTRFNLKAQPYRVIGGDGRIVHTGILDNHTARIYTNDSEKVRCEIGSGPWRIEENSYDHEQEEDDQS